MKQDKLFLKREKNYIKKKKTEILGKIFNKLKIKLEKNKK